jgi:hypothetical protein
MDTLLYREALLEPAADTAEERDVFPVAFASEIRVKRRDERDTSGESYYFEVLVCEPGTVDLDLFNRGDGMLLQDHDTDLEIGEICAESASVCDDRKVRASIKVTDEDWLRCIRIGGRPPVSVGYIREFLREEMEPGRSWPTRYYSFQPFEVSLLTTEAADETAGLYRSKTMRTSFESRLINAARRGTGRGEYAREQLTEEFSIVKLLRGEADDDSFERTVAKTTKRIGNDEIFGHYVPYYSLLTRHRAWRDMQATVFGAGGAAAQTVWHPTQEVLFNHAIAVPLGAEVVPGLKGDFFLPKITGAIQPGMASEIALAGQTQPVTDGLSYSPCRATAVVQVSKQMLMQAAGSEDTLRSHIRRAISIEADRLIFRGQGANNEPLGLLNVPNMNTVIFGGAATWAGVVSFETQLGLLSADGTGADGGPGGRLGFGIDAATRGRWRQIQRAVNYPVFLMDDRGYVGQYPALVSQNLSAQSQCVFGDWSQLLILVWGDGIEIEFNPYTLATQGEAQLICHFWFNVVPVHKESFCISQDSAAQ